MLQPQGLIRDGQFFVRRFAPRSREGCLTCRIRRIKCDEGKPCCRRCQSTGRKCDGYPTSVKRKSLFARPASPTNALTVNGGASACEQQAFKYFQKCTARRLAGYFEDDVWDHIILQLSQTEPAIRHAMLAVSGLHQEILVRRGIADYKEQTMPGFSTEQYAKALNMFRALLAADQPSANVILACSLLFIHFEALQENFVSAMLHIQNIPTILEKTNSYYFQRIAPGIAEALTRIDIQCSMYRGSRVPNLAFWCFKDDISLPRSFENINHARRLINVWTSRMYYFMRTTADHIKYFSRGNAPLEVISESQKFEKAFVKMQQLLHDLEQECVQTHANRKRSDLLILMIRTKLNRALCIGCLHSEELIYDAYLDEFKTMLEMCKSLVSMQAGDERVSSVLWDEGLLQCLNFLASVCRDRIVRHEALDQLDRLAAIRQSWHVEAVRRMTQRCVQLEEGSPARDLESQEIPEWRRIHSYGFDSLQNCGSRSIHVEFKFLGNGLDGGWNDYEDTIHL